MFRYLDPTGTEVSNNTESGLFTFSCSNRSTFKTIIYGSYFLDIPSCKIILTL